MLISLRRKFVFIANLKCASTAIETRLRAMAEIALVESRFGKHLPLSMMEQRFGWVFQQVPRQDFIIFGVLRDPIQYMVSLFNSHSDNKFKDNERLYTGEMDFDIFLDKWCTANRGQVVPQHTRFLRDDGTIGANFIISYEKISEGWRQLASLIGAANLQALPMVNVSNQRVRAEDLSSRQLDWISRQFDGDYRFMDFCDRRLTRDDQHSWTQPADTAGLVA
ncbi:MAG TPA: sulfotransferase family 2 domain-containing protein [Pirellulales bacterium]|jgi:hypothetical protein|nr:sulfotransferase family 2 domain-containing protein [Pirellulales bacterium]